MSQVLLQSFVSRPHMVLQEIAGITRCDHGLIVAIAHPDMQFPLDTILLVLVFSVAGFGLIQLLRGLIQFAKSPVIRSDSTWIAGDSGSGGDGGWEWGDVPPDASASTSASAGEGSCDFGGYDLGGYDFGGGCDIGDGGGG